MPPRTRAAKPAEAKEETAAPVVAEVQQPAWMASLRPIAKLSRAPRKSNGRAPKDNGGYEEAVKYSAGLVEGFDGGALAFTVDSAEDADEARKALRRAATALKLGLSHEILVIDGENAGKYADTYPDAVERLTADQPAVWVVEYQARTETRKHNYTTADVKAWLVAQGIDVPAGRLPQEYRDQYRKAHGLPVKEKTEG